MRRILFLQGACDEVDDAVQEVFLKVFRASPLPDEERFLAWFYRLILNTGRDQARRRHTRDGLAARLAALDPGTAASPAEPPDPALREALAALPRELRECVALRFLADLALDDIAAAQGVPVGTVKSRLHTAVSRLRAALGAAPAQGADTAPASGEGP